MSNRVSDWIAAENAGLPEEADKRCRMALSALPRRSPTAGFADRVLVAAGIGVPSGEARLLARWWSRAAVAALVCLAAWGALAFLSNVGTSGLASMSGAGFGLLTFVLTEAGEWAAVVAGAASVMVDIGRAAQTTVRTPICLSFVVAIMSLAAGSLYAMARLVSPREEFERC
ncbi:MAG: hypothetical protein ACE148_12130 [Vicinamibacterales bacterium]